MSIDIKEAIKQQISFFYCKKHKYRSSISKICPECELEKQKANEF